MIVIAFHWSPIVSVPVMACVLVFMMAKASRGW
jgi:hypothetical protein